MSESHLSSTKSLEQTSTSSHTDSRRNPYSLAISTRERKRLERDIERDVEVDEGGAGVYNMDMKSAYHLIVALNAA